MSDQEECSLCGFHRHHDRHRFTNEPGFHHFQCEADEEETEKEIKSLKERVARLERILVGNRLVAEEETGCPFKKD